MGDKRFVDYYEALQVSPNADGETIERVFRHLLVRADELPPPAPPREPRRSRPD